MSAGPIGFVLPVRAFQLGKVRLADDLSLAGRAELAAQMADTVRRAIGAWPLVVVTSAPEVMAWAQATAADHDTHVILDPGSLDAAAAAGVEYFEARGAARVVVVHADLPRARTLDAFARDAGQPVVTLVPCHRDDGTNVLSVPAGSGFRFAYGPSSFRRHLAEARRLGLATRVLRDPNLAFDVDLPSDLAAISTPRP